MKKSNEMPALQTFDYSPNYRVTKVFMNDLDVVLADVAYVDAKKIYDEITTRDGILPAAILNEFIRKLCNLPYKYVSGLMSNIGKAEVFQKYFEKVQVNNKES